MGVDHRGVAFVQEWPPRAGTSSRGVQDGLYTLGRVLGPIGPNLPLAALLQHDPWHARTPSPGSAMPRSTVSRPGPCRTARVWVSL